MKATKVTRIQRALNRLLLPKTKIDYRYTMSTEPVAWKWIIMSLLPTSFLLMPSMFFSDLETIPAIAPYPNILNSAIGLLMFLGATSVIWGWWANDTEKRSQSWRVGQEIRGLYFITGAFLTIALCGLPTVMNAVFTFFLSTGCALGSAARLYTLTLSIPTLEAREEPAHDAA